jgi:nicotinic acid mononucleotide adenylyltransferase
MNTFLLLLALSVPSRAVDVNATAAGASALSLPPSAMATVTPALAVPAGPPATGAVAPLIQAPAVAAPLARSAAVEPAVARSLEVVFASLDLAYHLPANSPTAAVRARVRAQLLAASRELESPESALLETVALESDRALVRIQTRLDAGEIDPSRSVRVSEADPEIASINHHMRIGVYPVAADPFQWAHLVIGLRAIGDLGLDKVVYILQGDDPIRKPLMTPVPRRHPMGEKVLEAFSPFFTYSPIAIDTTLDGETNIFRLLQLNAAQKLEAWYMVGDDHYRLLDARGNPDTLPKLERNITTHYEVVSPTLHTVKVAFIKRDGAADPVPTSLVVQFLDHAGFEASSSQVRNGRHTLLPFSAIDYTRRQGDWLYGIAPAAGVNDRRSGPRSGAQRRQGVRVKPQ